MCVSLHVQDRPRQVGSTVPKVKGAELLGRARESQNPNPRARRRALCHPVASLSSVEGHSQEEPSRVGVLEEALMSPQLDSLGAGDGTEGSSWESRSRMWAERLGAEARTGLTGDGLKVPPTQTGSFGKRGTTAHSAPYPPWAPFLPAQSWASLPGAPTSEGEPKAGRARSSGPQHRCPEQGQARDHGGGLSPPQLGGSGCSGFSRSVQRSLEPPWTLPRELEEDLQPGRGREARGASLGIRLQPLGGEAGGSHSASEPPLPPL